MLGLSGLAVGWVEVVPAESLGLVAYGQGMPEFVASSSPL